MQTDVIENTYNLIEAIKDDPKYKRLMELNDIINNDYKNYLEAFDKAKKDYLEASKYGKYHPSLSLYEKNLSETKAALYNLDYVKEYNLIYRELQNEIDDMMNKIKLSISEELVGGFNGCKK